MFSASRAAQQVTPALPSRSRDARLLPNENRDALWSARAQFSILQAACRDPELAAGVLKLYLASLPGERISALPAAFESPRGVSLCPALASLTDAVSPITEPLLSFRLYDSFLALAVISDRGRRTAALGASPLAAPRRLRPMPPSLHSSSAHAAAISVAAPRSGRRGTSDSQSPLSTPFPDSCVLWLPVTARLVQGLPTEIQSTLRALLPLLAKVMQRGPAATKCAGGSALSRHSRAIAGPPSCHCFALRSGRSSELLWHGVTVESASSAAAGPTD